MQQLHLPSAAAAPTMSAAAEADQRRTKMSWLMVGAAAVIMIGSFLPWASAAGQEGLAGFSWGPGKLTLISGLLLGLYGCQGLRKDPNVRYHGGAIAAVSVSLLVTFSAIGLIDEIDRATFHIVGAEPGTGLWLAVTAGLFAIWPLVQLRKDAKRR